MRTERLLRADGIIYGNVKGYYEDKHTYTFVINRKDIVFPKARYKLNKKDRYYDMDNRWNEDLPWRMEESIMNDEYRIEVNTGSGGYGFTDTLAELLADVKFVYGKKEVEKVSIWTKSSKEGDEYVSEDKRMHIWNIGKS